jgi:hypothetical protein
MVWERTAPSGTRYYAMFRIWPYQWRGGTAVATIHALRSEAASAWFTADRIGDGLLDVLTLADRARGPPSDPVALERARGGILSRA